MVYAEDRSFVAPGQPICVEEEFLPGENVRKLKENLIISTKAGVVEYDKSKRIVNVLPVKIVEEISLRDKVLIEVKEVQEKIAIVEIIAVNNKPLKHRRTAVILPNPKMKQEMGEYIGVGDLVIAEVVTLFSGVIGLSIWKNDLGAVLSICSKCGRVLRKMDKILICIKCENREKRKIVPYYGNIIQLGNILR
ncbi:MAG: exosome complex RNA-binding protein Csl4 [Aigarchaeota archaeon]|nr:exosome complex RNA-binding protein Csl4 [Aigarchaeota archaeon]MCX8192543.1 exosome complex RNA-binding protein Csl4 [Nitrososphaeria archaeon]MDW7985721.1 exosome complex RNA-binding protein Csl4 [Nitrososphaerota archaeon]